MGYFFSGFIMAGTVVFAIGILYIGSSDDYDMQELVAFAAFAIVSLMGVIGSEMLFVLQWIHQRLEER